MKHLARQIVSLTALLGVLLSTHGPLVARAVFEFRQDVLAAHHCENRFKPDVKCDGFCVLKKHLHQHHGHDQRDAERAVQPTVLPVVLMATAATSPALVSPPFTSVTIPELRQVYPTGHPASIDPPPRVI